MPANLALPCAAGLLLLALAWKFRRPTVTPAVPPELLVRALEREDQLRSELRASRQELQHLEGFSQQLASLSGRDFPALAELLLTTLAGLLPSQSQALFVPGEDGWICPAIRSPHRERVTSAALAGLRESVLDRAQETRVLAHQDGKPDEKRFFPDEKHSLALPMGESFVLYVGRLAPEYRGHEASLLGLLARLAAPALEISWRLWQQAHALRVQQSHQQGLEARLGILDRILNSLGRLQSCTGWEELLDELKPSLQSSFEHHWGGLVWRGERCRAWPEDLELPAELVASDRPLLFADLASTRFATPGLGSLMLCSLKDGCLWLGHAERDAFHEEDGKALQTFAYQLGTLLENTRLHDETREALHKLQQSEEQLIQSGKMAAVGQLAAGVAHELNTPLGTVLLNITGAERASPDEKVRKKLTRAREEVLRAREIVDRLLHYSRLKSEDRPPTNLTELLSQSWSLLEAQFRLDGVSMVQNSELPADLLVACQPNEIQQVFHNLLLNARDSLLTAGVQDPIEVHLARDGEGVRVEVTDHGAGIPAAVQSRIFEPFFTTKDVGAGTGLGLSISRQILAKHGGELSFTSQSGRTTFWFRLP